jgi:hypothetical protein
MNIIFSKKCNATNCEEVFHEGWCSSFGLSRNLAKVTKVEGPKDNLGSVQLTPTTSNQNIQIGIQSYNCNLKFD